MISKYHQLPEVVRWVLLVPLVVVLTVIVCEVTAAILGESYFMVRQAVAISAFILFLYLFAPRWQKALALAVLAARVLIVGLVLAIGLAHGRPLTTGVWIDLEREALGLAAGVLVSWLLIARVRVQNEHTNSPFPPTPTDAPPAP